MAVTIIGAITGPVIGLVLIAIITLVFGWLWNTTMQDVFSGRTSRGQFSPET